MSEQPKSKILIIIIGTLLIANILMLSFFILTNKRVKKERTDKSGNVAGYLQKEVGFDAAQMARYDSLSKQHREQSKIIFKQLSGDRKEILNGLAAASFTDSAIAIAAGNLHDRQKVFELNMLKHLKDIRDICNPAQRARFDTGFYKIFGRRGEAHKEK